MNKIKNVTIGGDPEGFFRSLETGKYVPSFYYLKGDKYHPTKISDNNHAIQCDNVMFEYNFPPCKTKEQFIKENLFVQNYLKDTVATPNNLELVMFPYVQFDNNDLIDDRALIFGCDPDYNTYTNGEIPNKVGKAEINGRCAGGHIHIGYDNPNVETNLLIIKALDLFVSLPLMFMEPNNRRKEMYGKAGAFRHQSFGVEYRCSSNWIYSSPELMGWAFEQVTKAIDFLNKNYNSKLFKNNELEKVINSKNLEKANKLISELKINVLTTNLVK